MRIWVAVELLCTAEVLDLNQCFQAGPVLQWEQTILFTWETRHDNHQRNCSYYHNLGIDGSGGLLWLPRRMAAQSSEACGEAEGKTVAGTMIFDRGRSGSLPPAKQRVTRCCSTPVFPQPFEVLADQHPSVAVATA